MLSELISNLRLVLEQLNDENVEQRSHPDFSLEAFWKQFADIAKAISYDATKISISFSKPPVPNNKDCETLSADVERSVLALVSLFYSLPRHQGALIVKECRYAARDMVTGLVVLLAQIAKAEGVLQSLHYTGTVWEACDAVQKLPRDNQQALLMKIKEVQELVKDALDEIHESLSDDSNGMCVDDDETNNRDAWSEDDRLLIQPCLGLVKAVRGLLKRLRSCAEENARIDDVLHITCMDEVYVVNISKLSPAVDDLITCLYAPMQYTSVKHNATVLADLLTNAAEYARTCVLCSETDLSWVDVLERAVYHNMDKVKHLTRDSVC